MIKRLPIYLSSAEAADILSWYQRIKNQGARMHPRETETYGAVEDLWQAVNADAEVAK